MTQPPCVTTTMRGRPCVILGEHLDVCLWHQLEEAAQVEGVTVGMLMQARTEVGLPNPTKPCRGCLPRPAVGNTLLCDTCWPKLTDALSILVDFVTHLRSIQRGPQSVDGVRVATGSKVIIPASWLAADDIWAHLVALVIAHAGDPAKEPEWPPAAAQRVELGFSTQATPEDVGDAVQALLGWLGDPQRVVTRAPAAAAAVELFRNLQTHLHRFPMEDVPIDMPLLRCRRCKMFAVRQHPPLEVLGPQVLRCDVCDHEADPLLIDWDLKLYAQEVWEGMTAVQRANVLPGLDTDQRRVLRELSRTGVETMRADVWRRLGDELGHTARTVWFNKPRPEWGDLTADQMIEAGRGQEVLNLIGAAA